MRFSISRQLRMYHSDMDVLFSYFLTGFATDMSFLQYICSMIRVTLSLIRSTLVQFFTFCLLMHLNTERESIGKKRTLVGLLTNECVYAFGTLPTLAACC